VGDGDPPPGRAAYGGAVTTTNEKGLVPPGRTILAVAGSAQPDSLRARTRSGLRSALR